MKEEEESMALRGDGLQADTHMTHFLVSSGTVVWYCYAWLSTLTLDSTWLSLSYPPGLTQVNRLLKPEIPVLMPPVVQLISLCTEVCAMG